MMSSRPALVSNLVPFFKDRRYEPGDRVPSERELAERFNVSRNQIREALSYLEALRIVERRSKSGVFMAESGPSLEAMVLYAKLGLPVDEKAVRQAGEMRRCHEIGAVRLAAHNRTAEDLERLTQLLDAESALIASGENMAEADRAFHLAVIRATQNDVLFNLSQIFYAMSEKLRHFYFCDGARQARSHRDHKRIFSAIKRGDADAAEAAMTDHLAGAEIGWNAVFAKETQQA